MRWEFFRIVLLHCVIFELHHMLMHKWSFAHSDTNLFCDYSQQIIWSVFTVPVCQKSIQTAVIVSVLLFDPFAKENKTHTDNLVVCASIYVRFLQHCLRKCKAYCHWSYNKFSIIPARFNRIKTVEHTGKSSEKQNSQQKKEQLNTFSMNEDVMRSKKKQLFEWT